ncbi:hypothetical protein GGX14DRAFT_456519, partial [Mycena pura]
TACTSTTWVMFLFSAISQNAPLRYISCRITAYPKRMVCVTRPSPVKLVISNRTYPSTATVKNTPLWQSMYRIRTSAAYTKRPVLCVSLTRPLASALKIKICNRTQSWNNFYASSHSGSEPHDRRATSFKSNMDIHLPVFLQYCIARYPRTISFPGHSMYYVKTSRVPSAVDSV